MPQIKRIRLLWLDDDGLILATVRRFLRGKDLELVTLSSAQEAIALIKSQDFDVIVSDQRMPESTGVEFLEAAKAIQPLAARILLTGFDSPELIQEAVNRAGIIRFLIKPWDDEQLLLELSMAAEHSRAQRAQASLRQEVRTRNHELRALTENLELLVEGRTQDLEEARAVLLSEERRIKALVRFLKAQSEVADLEQWFEDLDRELKRIGSVGLLLVGLRSPEGARFLFKRQGQLTESRSEEPWLKLEGPRFFDERDRQYWARVLGRPMPRLICFPLYLSNTDESVLVIESSGEPSPLIARELVERLSILALSLERSLLTTNLTSVTRQWESTFDGLIDPLAIIDQDFSVIRGNHHFKEGGPCYRQLGGDRVCDGCPLLNPHNEGREVAVSIGSRLFEVKSRSLPSSGSGAHINHYRDVTEEKRLYGLAVQSEKMAALGSLAGSIAHELNNPLTGIRSVVQVLLKTIKGHNQLLEDLGEIEMAAERSQEIIRNLKKFADGGTQANVLNFNDVIDSTIPLLRASLRHLNVHIEKSESLPPVRGQSSLLQQVLFNLVLNSSHATPNGGDIWIETSVHGENVVLSVRDSGSGIPRELHEKVFEPFFTTKDSGEGTGLGLSFSRGALRQLGGEIHLSSEVGQGSRFDVLLPRAKL